jgi:hypothetical protein
MGREKGAALTALGSFISYYVVPRRLEDRIRSLSNQVLHTQDPCQQNQLHDELRSLLREHMERLRKLLTTIPVPPERRHPH